GIHICFHILGTHVPSAFPISVDAYIKLPESPNQVFCPSCRYKERNSVRLSRKKFPHQRENNAGFIPAGGEKFDSFDVA
ncbi:MAG TPA: hypothetical protein PKM59_02110, partial [Thermodesulfobacteriota bacterium]|nr:hypothetical protein [Thermodesulfobacteriota bacterium]